MLSKVAESSPARPRTRPTTRRVSAASFDGYRHCRTTAPAAETTAATCCMLHDIQHDCSSICSLQYYLRGLFARVMCSLSRTCSRSRMPPNHPLYHLLHDAFRAVVYSGSPVSKRPRPVSFAPMPSSWACSSTISTPSHAYSHPKPGELARGPSGEPSGTLRKLSMRDTLV
jgi:hypothetical protein